MGPIRDLIAAVRGKATNSGGNTNANTDNGPASTSATTSNTGGGRRRGGRQNRDKGKLLTPIRDGCWKQESTRHQYVESIMESRKGRVLGMLPFIFIMALSSTSTQLSLWLAFGFSLGMLIVNFYRSRYNTRLVFPMVIDVASFVAFVILIILDYQLSGFTYRLVNPIIVSVIFGVMAISMLICKPFTMQFVAKVTTDEVWRSPEFFRGHMFVAGIWVCGMALVVVAVWVSYALCSDTNGACYIILSIVVPIVVPLALMLITSYIKSVKEGHDAVKAGVPITPFDGDVEANNPSKPTTTTTAPPAVGNNVPPAIGAKPSQDVTLM